MDKRDKPTKKASRALKRLEAHLISPNNEESRGHVGHSSTENSPAEQNDGSARRIVRESEDRRRSRSPSRRSRSSGRERGDRSRSSRRSGGKNAREESRSRSRSRARNTRKKRSHRSHSTSRETPAWAKELLCQQRQNADDLKKLKSQATGKPNEGSSTTARAVEHEFRYAGNKKQYDVNQSVMQRMDRALATGDLDEVSKEISAGKSLLMERNKHLLLADKYGWDTVECYSVEPLASDSEDEKRIKRAIKESKSLRNEKKASSSHMKIKKPFLGADKSTPNVAKGQGPFNFRARRQVLPPSGDNRATCFRCGKPGHFARECRSANARFVVSGATTTNQNSSSY